MELKASEEREGFGEVREEVRNEGREGRGVDVGLGERGGHGGETKAEVSCFRDDGQ